ncbi:hypothetical protein B7463_g12393, partial [Scytalidium lignicola]
MSKPNHDIEYLPIRSNIDEPQNSQSQLSTSSQSTQKLSYSAFTKRQKIWIVSIIASTAWFSLLSSFIFFPVITTLAEDLHTTVGRINLTVTSYLIFAAITPSVVGSFSDISGRRPAYIVTISLYVAANIGLACQNSFVALFVLRMLQSAGIAGSFSVSYGVIADIASPAERGSFVGAVAFGTNTAPSIGPILGAVLNAKVGWRWIFWFLAILSGICLTLISLTLPETARAVVGNGGIPAHGIHAVPFKKMVATPLPVDANKNFNIYTRTRWQVPNPLTCLKVLLLKDSFLVILVLGIVYMTYACLQTSLATLFIQIYGFDELQAGLIYIPFGIGCALAAWGAGKVLDRDYRCTAKAYNFTIDKKHGDELLDFPLEKARVTSIFYPITLAVVSTVGYGWCLERRTPYVIPLILQFFQGGSLQACSTILNTLLMDLNQDSASTSQACCNIIRCSLAAAALACLDPLVNVVGVGFCFTIIGGITSICIPVLLLERTRGWGWRLERERLRIAAVEPDSGVERFRERLELRNTNRPEELETLI